jgi:hypothetical protein
MGKMDRIEKTSVGVGQGGRVRRKQDLGKDARKVQGQVVTMFTVGQFDRAHIPEFDYKPPKNARRKRSGPPRAKPAAD